MARDLGKATRLWTPKTRVELAFREFGCLFLFLFVFIILFYFCSPTDCVTVSKCFLCNIFLKKFLKSFNEVIRNEPRAVLPSAFSLFIYLLNFFIIKNFFFFYFYYKYVNNSRMTLLSKNVAAMKPKSGIVAENPRNEPVYLKQNVKMAINRNLTAKKSANSSMDNYARGTVLVNNVNAVHRNPMANVRTIVSGTKNMSIPNSELLRCKRKIHFISGQSYPGAQPASVARRNARERNRVKQVNNGFATLRSHIPASVAAALSSEKSSPRNSSASKKLSKVETLKMAVEYIRSLQQMLEDHNSSLEKKVVIDQVGYEKQFEMDENYYSSSPETVHSGTIGDSAQSYPDDSPCRVFPKIEPLDSECYSHRQYAKSEPEDVYIKSETFNQKLHETLTSEFYGARSPTKSFYLSQEDEGNCDFKTGEKIYDPTGPTPIISDKLDYSMHEISEASPEKMADYGKRNRSPSLTVLTSVSANQVVQYSGQSFLQHHRQRNPASLSPTVSEACPSPTPSYSSDHSSVHLGSVASGSSAHLISSLSRLTTHVVPPSDSFSNQLTSPIPRSASPVIVNAPKCLTPPRTLSPLSTAPKYIVPDPTSSSNQSSYSVNMEFQKGSPEGYENYDSVSPEDEELLDVISWWQQSH